MFIFLQLLLVSMLITASSSLSVLVCGCCKKNHQRKRITRNRPPSNASEIDSNSKKPDDRQLAEPRTAMKSTIDTNPEAVVQGPRSMPPDEKVKQIKAENNTNSKIKHSFSSTSARKKKRPADNERSIAVQKEPVAQPNAASMGNIDGIMKAKPKGYLAHALSGQHAFDDIHQKGKIRRPKPGEEAKIGKEGNYMFAMSAEASRTASLSAASLQEAVDMTPPIPTPVEDQQKQQPQQTQQQQSEQQLSTEMPKEDVKENVEEAAFVSSKTL